MLTTASSAQILASGVRTPDCLPTRADKPSNTQGLRIVLEETVEPSIVAMNAFCSLVKAVSQSRKSVALLFGYLPNGHGILPEPRLEYSSTLLSAVPILLK